MAKAQKKATAPRKKAAAPRKKATEPRKKVAAPRKKAAEPPKKVAAPRKKAAEPPKKVAAPRKKAAEPPKKVAAPPKKKEVKPDSPCVMCGKKTWCDCEWDSFVPSEFVHTEHPPSRAHAAEPEAEEAPEQIEAQPAADEA